MSANYNRARKRKAKRKIMVGLGHGRYVHVNDKPVPKPVKSVPSVAMTNGIAAAILGAAIRVKRGRFF
jgi:hypothetical protein